MQTAESRSTASRVLWALLFLAIFAGALWVPLYNRVDPTLFGFPFFYWFQFVWIIVTAVVTAAAYLRKV